MKYDTSMSRKKKEKNKEKRGKEKNPLPYPAVAVRGNSPHDTIRYEVISIGEGAGKREERGKRRENKNISTRK